MTALLPELSGRWKGQQSRPPGPAMQVAHPHTRPGLPSATCPASSRTRRLRPGDATAGQGGPPAALLGRPVLPGSRKGLCLTALWPQAEPNVQHAAGAEQCYAWIKQKHVYTPRKPTDAGACGWGCLYKRICPSDRHLGWPGGGFYGREIGRASCRERVSSPV